VSSISFLRSSSSSAFFFAALDFAVDLDAFEAAFLVRLEVDEDVEDFFRGLAVSFEVFFVAMRRTVPQLRVDCEIFTQYQPLSLQDVVTPQQDPSSARCGRGRFE
jgi:hypothetical protein